MFGINFGSANRENKIREIASIDKTTAIILAAVHFEWMLKRAILKLSVSPTKNLRLQLENIYRLRRRNDQEGYTEIWNREVGTRFKNSSLGTILGKLTQIQNQAFRVRGKVIHGNGTVSSADADQAIELFLNSATKLREFGISKNFDLDSRLQARIKNRPQL